jgi:hypothetical protein
VQLIPVFSEDHPEGQLAAVTSISFPFRTNKPPTRHLSTRSSLGVSGFGGLVVSMLASDTQDRRFEPGRSRRIFRAKKSTAHLPSEGK